MATTTTNSYLDGNFAPVRSELTVDALPVRGRIPPELRGVYVRNGPNPVRAPDPASYHWFTGEGMVHGIRLEDGAAAWYRNRFVRSPAVAAALGEPPPPSSLPPDRPVFAANTNIVRQAGRLLALVEAGPVPIELTADLDTVGPSDLDGTLPFGFTAHPKRDPATGELHAVAYFWARPETVQYLVVGIDGRVRVATDVAVPGQPMMHDLAITESRAVLFDLPCTFSLDAAKGGDTLPYRWDPAYGARVGVLPLGAERDDAQWFEVEPCYVFHPLNAYDEADGRLVVDVIRHPKVFATDVQGPNEGASTLWRWTVDPTAGTVREEQLDDHSEELPRLDERRLGRRHRYGYAISTASPFGHGPTLKHDLVAGATEAHDHGPGRGGLEPVFVARAPDAPEDDGWVLAVVYDATTDGSELVIWPAADFTSEPVAVVALPQRVPFGFHGNWLPDPS